MIRILAAAHKKTDAPQNRYIRLIQAGSAIAEKRLPGMLHDDEGVHISHRNRSYCELTVQYYAWKNIEADYYGFFHYRRYMDFSKEYPPRLQVKEQAKNAYTCNKFVKRRFFRYAPMPYTRTDSLFGKLQDYGLQEEKIRTVVEKYDVITVPGESMDVTVYQQFGQFHDRRDLDRMIRILHRRHPAFADACESYMHSRYIYFCNMYVMRREYFQAYMEWLFPLLEEFEQEKDVSRCSGKQARITGYLAERLFGIYYTWLNQQGRAKCCELPYVIFGKEPDTRRFRLWQGGPQLVMDMKKVYRLLPPCSLRRRLVRRLFRNILA